MVLLASVTCIHHWLSQTCLARCLQHSLVGVSHCFISLSFWGPRCGFNSTTLTYITPRCPMQRVPTLHLNSACFTDPPWNPWQKLLQLCNSSLLQTSQTSTAWTPTPWSTVSRTCTWPHLTHSCSPRMLHQQVRIQSGSE